MIVETVNQIPELHGIIFIDCWEEACSTEKKQTIDNFYQLLVDCTSQYKFKCVVNSSIGMALDLRDPSVFNTFQKYSWGPAAETSLFVKTRRDQLLANLCRYAGRDPDNPLTTSKIIQDHFLDNGVLLLDGLDLIFHNDLFCNSECKNWLVVGQTWQMCVHDNNMGLKQFTKLSQDFGLNFYATDYSFLKDDGTCANDNDFVNDTLKWTRIMHFGYQLMPDNLNSNQFPMLRYKYYHA